MDVPYSMNWLYTSSVSIMQRCCGHREGMYGLGLMRHMLLACHIDISHFLRDAKRCVTIVIVAHCAGEDLSPVHRAP